MCEFVIITESIFKKSKLIPCQAVHSTADQT